MSPDADLSLKGVLEEPTCCKVHKLQVVRYITELELQLKLELIEYTLPVAELVKALDSFM